MSLFDYNDGGSVTVLKMATGTTYKSLADRLSSVFNAGSIQYDNFDAVLRKEKVAGIDGKCYWAKYVDDLIVVAPRFGVTPLFVNAKGEPVSRSYEKTPQGHEAAKAFIGRFLEMVSDEDPEVVQALENCVARISASRRRK